MCCFPSSEVGDGVTNSAVSVPLSDRALAEVLLHTVFVRFWFCFFLATYFSHVVCYWEEQLSNLWSSALAR